MKHAVGPNGEAIIARATAPPQANCPGCGGIVVLRKRRLMGRKGVTYFWRHVANRQQHCSLRTRPIVK